MPLEITGTFGAYPEEDPAKIAVLRRYEDDPKFQDILYSSKPPTPSSTIKRDEFRVALNKILNDPDKVNKKEKLLIALYRPEQATTTLNELLGRDITDLYKQAINEEESSWEFRQAVFLKSMRIEPGPAFDKGPVIWIGGPSGAGKSYATEEALKKFFPGQSTETAEKVFMMADGGISRNTSQVRNMVLNTALTLGYSGINDLEENTHIKIKKEVLKASKSDIRTGFIIPETFAPLGVKLKGLNTIARVLITTPLQIDLGRFKDVDAFSSEERKQYFIVVKAPSSIQRSEQMFEQVVKYQGTARAFGVANPSLDLSNMNTYSGIESKAYNPDYFSNGVSGSKRASRDYRKTDEYYFVIENSRQVLCFDIKTDSYRECNANDVGAFIVSKAEAELVICIKIKVRLNEDTLNQIRPIAEKRALVLKDKLDKTRDFLKDGLTDKSSISDSSLELLTQNILQTFNELNYLCTQQLINSNFNDFLVNFHKDVSPHFKQLASLKIDHTSRHGLHSFADHSSFGSSVASTSCLRPEVMLYHSFSARSGSRLPISPINDVNSESPSPSSESGQSLLTVETTSQTNSPRRSDLGSNSPQAPLHGEHEHPEYGESPIWDRDSGAALSKDEHKEFNFEVEASSSSQQKAPTFGRRSKK